MKLWQKKILVTIFLLANLNLFPVFGQETVIINEGPKKPVMYSVFWNTLWGSAWGATMGFSYHLISGIKLRESLITSTTIGGLLGGGFVSVWTQTADNGGDGDHSGIFAKIFDGTGAGNAFQVNTHTVGYQDEAAVTGLADGGFVICWQSGNNEQNQDGSGSGIYGQAFHADGSQRGSEFRINIRNIVN